MRRLAHIIIASLIVAAATASPVDSIAIVAKTVLAYAWLVLLPGLAWVYPLHRPELESFVLANLAGFAFGFVYFLLDVLGVPIVWATFVTLPIIVAIAGILFWGWHARVSVRENTNQ